MGSERGFELWYAVTAFCRCSMACTTLHVSIVSSCIPPITVRAYPRQYRPSDHLQR